MTLVNAGFLTAGLLAASIPILIHFLFRRRRPPIDWAAMDILLAAFRRQERRLRLEQLILLTARCLLFAVAGLALARPLLESGGLLAPSGGRTITLLLDDGVVTQGIDAGAGGASDFDRLKARSAELVRGLAAGDAVGVVLASRPARSLVMPPSTDRDAVARAIEAIQPSQASTDLLGAMNEVRAAIDRAPEATHVVVLASEFRLGSIDPTQAPPLPPNASASPAAGHQAPTVVAFPPATDDRPDIGISTIEAQRSVDDDSITVGVRLERAGGGNAPASVRVTLAGDGTMPVTPKSVRFDAGQASAMVEFALRPANEASGGEARIGSGAIVARIDGDAMPANDAHYAIFDARSATRIGIVARRSFGSGAELEQVPAARWIARALNPVEQPGLDVAEIDPLALDAAALRDLDALVLPRPELVEPAMWTELRRFVDRGALLVVMPSSESPVQRWTEAFRTALGLPWEIESDVSALDAPLGFAAEQPHRGDGDATFAAVQAELPELLRPIEVARRMAVRGASPADMVLTLSDGSPFLLAAAPGIGDEPKPGQSRASRGMVAVITTAPELAWTNLPVKPFMVPFLQELVRKSLAAIGSADRATVGSRPFVPLRDAHELRGPDGRRIAIADGGAATSPVEAAGAWSVADVAGRVVGGLPVNVEFAATRMAPRSQQSIAAWLAPFGQVSFGGVDELLGQLAPEREVTGIAVWLLAALVAIAVVETALARWFSHAANASGARFDAGVTASALRDGEDGAKGAVAGTAPEAAA